ncbi:hypothetical protein AB0F72_31660 [Actinoplanes sp. NPDC023936]
MDISLHRCETNSPRWHVHALPKLADETIRDLNIDTLAKAIRRA